MSEPSCPVPDLEAPAFAPFWQGCREERLLIQRCGRGHLSWPPRPACPRCQDTTRDWQEVAGVGWLYSWTVVHRTPLPAFRPLTPYVVGIVELTAHPGVRLLGRFLDSPGLDSPGQDSPGQPRIGLPLRVKFEKVTPEFTLPVWQRDGADEPI